MSVLTPDDLTRLRDFAGYDPALVDMARLDQAIDRAADDRLDLAKEFLAFAGVLLGMSAQSDDMAARNALARTYYAAHHAIRAVALYRNRTDEYDHREAIKTFGKMVGNNPMFREKLKEILAPGSKPDEVENGLVNLLDMRHAADYHGYGTKDPKRPPLDFAAEAANAQRWVGLLIEKIGTYVTERRAGLYR